ncbi:MAG: hypothetical protein FWG94_08120 [Oscillospiraceae bacterium]|nr:hypothetical protein [Oscillospiraceae bacterium]
MLGNGQRKTTIITILITLGVLLLVAFLALNIFALQKEPNFIYVFYEATEDGQSPIVVSETNPILNEPVTPLEAMPPGEAVTEEAERQPEPAATIPPEGSSKLNIPVAPLVAAGVLIVAATGAYFWKKGKSDDDEDDNELEDEGDLPDDNNDNRISRGYKKSGRGSNRRNNFLSRYHDEDENYWPDNPEDEADQQNFVKPTYNNKTANRQNNNGNRPFSRLQDENEDNGREELDSKANDLDSDDIALINEIERLRVKSDRHADYVLELAENMDIDPPLELVESEDSEEYPADEAALRREIRRLKIKINSLIDYVEEKEGAEPPDEKSDDDGAGNPFLVCVAKTIHNFKKSGQALQAPQNENVIYIPSAKFFTAISELLPGYKRKEMVEELKQHEILDCSRGTHDTVYNKTRVLKINKNKFETLTTELAGHAS